MKRVKNKSITWFQISELCPDSDIVTKIYDIVRYMGRTHLHARAWAGRLKNGKGIFIRVYKTKIITQNIINW